MWLTWHKLRLQLQLLRRDPVRTDIEVTCTKERPWSGKTLPVLHVDADFLDDSDRFLSCPNCGYNWDIGPDV